MGARFFIDLLEELQRKTKGNLLPDEAAFLGDVLENMQKLLAKKIGSGKWLNEVL